MFKYLVKSNIDTPPLFPTIEGPGNEATVTTETPMFIILQAKLTLKIEIWEVPLGQHRFILRTSPIKTGGGLK